MIAETAAATPAIRARGLSRLYGPLRALDEVDLDVVDGDAVAVLGPNGAGKTTLLRILTLGLRASSGSLSIAGLDPRADELAIRARIGFISDTPRLYDHLTALENLTFFAKLYGLPRAEERARGSLAGAALESRAHDAVGTLSRGLRQQVSLLRALIHDPRILYLDEPFTALDARAVEALCGLLRRLRHQGRTIVLVSHDLPRAVEITDRWLLIHHGRIVDADDSRATDVATFRERYRRATGEKTVEPS